MNFRSNLWFDNSLLLQELGGVMIAKDRAEAKDYVLKLAKEQDIKFIGRSLLAFLTVSSMPLL